MESMKFTIADNGITLSQNDLNHLFNKNCKTGDIVKIQQGTLGFDNGLFAIYHYSKKDKYELAKEAENHPEYKNCSFSYLGHGVVSCIYIKNRRVQNIGAAICNPKEIFQADIGRAIAFYRVIGMKESNPIMRTLKGLD